MRVHFRRLKSNVYKKGQLPRTKLSMQRQEQSADITRLLYIDVPGYYKYNEIQFSSVIKSLLRISRRNIENKIDVLLKENKSWYEE